eukprot:14198656-Alexandrium_andersonii.AAC.1
MTRGSTEQAEGEQEPMEGLPADQGPAHQPPPAPESTGTDPYGCPYIFRSLQDVNFLKCTTELRRQELMGAFTRRVSCGAPATPGCAEDGSLP